jgi:hypothetical protein
MVLPMTMSRRYRHLLLMGSRRFVQMAAPIFADAKGIATVQVGITNPIKKDVATGRRIKPGASQKYFSGNCSGVS